jgi:hypothetical protein
MSLSLDMATLFTNAQLIVNSLWPVAAIGIGFTLGVGILSLVVRVIGGALHSR